jgi:ParB family chromosome partitioning protein
MTDTDGDEYCVRLIPTASLTISGLSVRTNVRAHDSAITELADSISGSGIIEPIVVRATGGETFEVIAGERRLIAAKTVNLDRVPCIVRTCSRSEALMMSLTENLQRCDLNAMEKARGLKRLLEEFRLTQADIGEHIGMSQSAIAHHLRLLLLPPEVQSFIEQGTLSMGHGKLLAGISDPNHLVELASTCVAEGASVRQLEESLSRTPGVPMKRHARGERPTKKRLEQELPNGVFLVIKESQNEPTCGTIEIPYYSREERDWVMTTLCRGHEPSRNRPRGTDTTSLASRSSLAILKRRHTETETAAAAN